MSMGKGQINAKYESRNLTLKSIILLIPDHIKDDEVEIYLKSV